MRVRRVVLLGGAGIVAGVVALLMPAAGAAAAGVAAAGGATAVSHSGPIGPVGLAWSLLPALVAGVAAYLLGRIAVRRRVRRSGLVWPR